MLIYRLRVLYFRGSVSNFNQSLVRKQCFLASDWLKFETVPREYRIVNTMTCSYHTLFTVLKTILFYCLNIYMTRGEEDLSESDTQIEFGVLQPQPAKTWNVRCRCFLCRPTLPQTPSGGPWKSPERPD